MLRKSLEGLNLCQKDLNKHKGLKFTVVTHHKELNYTSHDIIVIRTFRKTDVCLFHTQTIS